MPPPRRQEGVFRCNLVVEIVFRLERLPFARGRQTKPCGVDEGGGVLVDLVV